MTNDVIVHAPGGPKIHDFGGAGVGRRFIKRSGSSVIASRKVILYIFRAWTILSSLCYMLWWWVSVAWSIWTGVLTTAARCVASVPPSPRNLMFFPIDSTDFNSFWPWLILRGWRAGCGWMRFWSTWRRAFITLLPNVVASVLSSLQNVLLLRLSFHLIASWLGGCYHNSSWPPLIWHLGWLIVVYSHVIYS